MAVVGVVRARAQQTITFFRSEEVHGCARDLSQPSLKWRFSSIISSSTTTGNWPKQIKLLPTLSWTSQRAYPSESKPTLSFEPFIRLKPFLLEKTNIKYNCTNTGIRTTSSLLFSSPSLSHFYYPLTLYILYIPPQTTTQYLFFFFFHYCNLPPFLTIYN